MRLDKRKKRLELEKRLENRLDNSKMHLENLQQRLENTARVFKALDPNFNSLVTSSVFLDIEISLIEYILTFNLVDLIIIINNTKCMITLR